MTTIDNLIGSVEAALRGDAARAVATELGGRVYDRIHVHEGLRLDSDFEKEEQLREAEVLLAEAEEELAELRDELEEGFRLIEEAEQEQRADWGFFRGRRVRWREKEGLVIYAGRPKNVTYREGWLSAEHQENVAQGRYKEHSNIRTHGIALLVERVGERGKTLRPHLYWPKPQDLELLS